ncbi:flagellin lysine-N-methylase [Clostridium nigeriense]|uniref:flagellin lysine-N-methylase n=1 Tax=Clostridium nigeriense TaxID=1805470 RepID=UPI003D358FCD
MKIRTPDYFNEFKCIADRCEDTCCAGWGIVIDNESYEKYISMKGKFGEELRSKIINDDGDNIFLLKGDRCSFLNESNLCDIYSNLGSDGLCYTCRQYPRYLEEFGNLREVGISLSCPEASRIILGKKEKVKFQLAENNEEVNSYNDINPNIYMNLMQCRKIVFDILQDREKELKYRCGIILSFINEIQEKIDLNDINTIKDVNEKYLNKVYVYKTINSLQKFNDRLEEKYINIYKILNIFKDLKHIKPNDILGLENSLRYFWQNEEDIEVYQNLNNSFNAYYKDNEYQFEQILVYYVFRYFMKSVFDYDVLAKIKFAIVSFIIIRELSIIRYLENKELLDEDMVDIVHIYSRDIEHLEENIDILEELFETRVEFNIENLIITLCN